MVKIGLLVGFAALGLTSLVAEPAYASLALQFVQDGSTLTILDNGAGDTNPTLGAIGIGSGTVVGTYTITNAGGIGFPMVGSPTSPILDTNSLEVTNSGSPGTLRILVSQTDFATSGPVIFNGQIGGTMTTQLITYNSFLSQSNALFAETTPIDGPGGLSFNTSPFAGSLNGTLNTAPLYSLTEEIDVTGNASGQLVSFDAQLMGRPVPEPASLAIFGAALAGLGLLRRRRQNV